MNPSAPVNPEFTSNKLISDVAKLLTEKLNCITQTIEFRPKSRYDRKPEYFKLEVNNNEIELRVDNAIKSHANDHVVPEQIRQINIELNKTKSEYQLKLTGSIINKRDGTTTYTIAVEQKQEQHANLMEQVIEQ